MFRWLRFPMDERYKDFKKSYKSSKSKKNPQKNNWNIKSAILRILIDIIFQF